jgi:4-hydroxyphenylacetate decarboxylase large subunit
MAEKFFQINCQHGSKASEGLVDRENKKEPCKRAKKIRDLYFNTKSSVTIEFPYWYTRRYDELEGEIPIIRRAEALKCAFSHLTPEIFPDELLVMGKEFYLRGSFPMPWLSESYYMDRENKLYKEALEAGKVSSDLLTKWGEGGGNVTESAGNVVSIAGKFGLRKEELPLLLRVAKLWKGRSVEDLGHAYEQLVPGYDEKESIMRNVVCMFDSGYTLPQGREVINYYYPLQYGIDGIIDFCKEKSAEVAGNPGGDGVNGMDRLYFYKAVETVLAGIKKWMLNYAEETEKLANLEKNQKRRKELKEIEERLRWLSSKPPRDFRDALQLCWTFHVAVLNEDCISGMSPGRLGQVLYPFWKEDMEKGKISEHETMELLECMRMKFTELDCFASMGVVGGVLSGNTFNNLCIGGLDRRGKSAANELEMLILKSGMTCKTSQPTLTLLYDDMLPEEFLLKGIECTKTGAGYPAWVDNPTAMNFILRNYGPEGMTLEEARAWSIGGCLETSAGAWMPLKFLDRTWNIPGGAGPATSVGVHFISVPKILELVLFDGMDQRTGDRIFPAHGYKLETFDEVWEAFKKYFREAVRVLTLCNNIQHDVWRKINPPVISSMLKPDCLKKGKHQGQLGSRYNTTFNVEVCGGINLVNSLASLKKNVYDDKKFSLEELKEALKNNFGYRTAEEVGSYSLFEQVKVSNKYNKIHKFCMNAPKYGNDNQEVDSLFEKWENWFCSMTHEYRSLYDKPLYSCQISVSTHGPMGAATIATPDGRLWGTAFADGSVSVYPGTDLSGPYALFNSATVWDHSASQNSQMNLKLHPMAVKGVEGSKKLLELVRSYLRKGGFHIQFNVVDSRMLKDAQAHPERYRGLLVRVAGFTQYWVELGKQIQDEIIARTEYEAEGV